MTVSQVCSGVVLGLWLILGVGWIRVWWVKMDERDAALAAAAARSSEGASGGESC